MHLSHRHTPHSRHIQREHQVSRSENVEAASLIWSIVHMASIGLLIHSLFLGYVSPYPPLPPSCTQSAARQTTATAPVRRSNTRAPQSTTAPPSAQPQEDLENVREYTFPTSPMRRFQLPSFETMLDARTITQVGPDSRANILLPFYHRLHGISTISFRTKASFVLIDIVRKRFITCHGSC